MVLAPRLWRERLDEEEVEREEGEETGKNKRTSKQP